jgi:hypothetical protein
MAPVRNFGERRRASFASDLAGVVTLSGEELGPYVEVNDELVAEQFVCPSCAASLWVEVLSPKAPPASDFALAT